MISTSSYFQSLRHSIKQSLDWIFKEYLIPLLIGTVIVAIARVILQYVSLNFIIKPVLHNSIISNIDFLELKEYISKTYKHVKALDLSFSVLISTFTIIIRTVIHQKGFPKPTLIVLILSLAWFTILTFGVISLEVNQEIVANEMKKDLVEATQQSDYSMAVSKIKHITSEIQTSDEQVEYRHNAMKSWLVQSQLVVLIILFCCRCVDYYEIKKTPHTN